MLKCLVHLTKCNLRLLIFISTLLIFSCQEKKTVTDSNINLPNKVTETPGATVNSDDEFDERKKWQKPDKVIDMLGDLENKVVADIGAGIGYFSVKLLPRAKKVIATDIDTSSISILKNIQKLNERYRGKLDVRLATPDDTKILDNELDLILIVNTITYISNRKEYLRNLEAKLKPGGHLVIVDFKTKKFPEFIKDAPAYEDRIYLHVIEEELESVGYTIVRSDDTSLDYQFVVFATLQ